MLVLTRKRGDTIEIGPSGGIVIKVLDILSGGRVRIGITAPKEMQVHRGEISEAIRREGPREARDEAV